MVGDKQNKMGHCLCITVNCDGEMVGSVSDYLEGVFGAGVEVQVDQVNQLKQVNGFLDNQSLSGDRSQQILEKVRVYVKNLAGIFNVNPPSVAIKTIEAEDWGNSWKKHFDPFEVYPQLFIVPTWVDYIPEHGQKVLLMDPGMAFGTGHHETTSMCLALYADSQKCDNNHRVLDVGTGTGILGMSAILLGASEVLGIDNDPEAVRVASENITLNSMDSQITISEQDIGDVEGTYDTVLVNIIHDVIISMADLLVEKIETGGSIVLSGILSGKQKENIQKVFEGLGLKVEAEMALGEWAAMRMIR